MLACTLFFMATSLATFSQTGVRQPAEAVKPQPPIQFAVSKETTYFTKPLSDNGRVDYVAALNRHLSKGVSPQNNAAVSFFQAFGPGRVPKKLRPKLFKELGVKPLPEKGNYYIPLEASVKLPQGPARDAALERLNEEFDQCLEGPWKKQQYPDIAKWIDANEEVFEYFTSGGKRPRFYTPWISEASSTGGLLEALQSRFEFDVHKGSRQIARIVTIRAFLHLGEGRTAEAVEDVLTCHRWARLIEQEGTIIGSLVGVALEAIACHADRQLVASGKLSRAQATQYLKELDKLGPPIGPSEALNTYERCFILELIAHRDGWRFVEDLIATSQGGDAVQKLNEFRRRHSNRTDYFDWNIVLADLNSRFDRAVGVAAVVDPGKRRAAAAAFDDEIKRASTAKRSIPAFLKRERLQEVDRKAASHWLAKLLISELDLAGLSNVDSHDRSTARFQVSRVAFALAAYRAEHGSYPEKLDSLTPKYIAKLPSDPFSGRLFRYQRSKKGFLLYSVGPNGVDDGGRDDFDPGLRRLHDDIVVRTPDE